MECSSRPFLFSRSYTPTHAHKKLLRNGYSDSYLDSYSAGYSAGYFTVTPMVTPMVTL